MSVAASAQLAGFAFVDTQCVDVVRGAVERFLEALGATLSASCVPGQGPTFLDVLTACHAAPFAAATWKSLNSFDADPGWKKARSRRSMITPGPRPRIVADPAVRGLSGKAARYRWAPNFLPTSETIAKNVEGIAAITVAEGTGERRRSILLGLYSQCKTPQGIITTRGTDVNIR